MSDSRSIAFVAPPFGGHLFPQLELARRLHNRGCRDIRFYSTPEASSAVSLRDFPLTRLLEGKSHRVIEISDTPQRVGSNPFRLYGQFRANLSLMSELKEELRGHWERRRPDVVIADLTVPIPGLLAQEMGIHWWTSLPTACVIETGSETPSYLGGWMPPKTVLGQIRDRIGRQVIRGFKLSVHRLFRKQLTALGVESIYRSDGFETVYSPNVILAFGARELEFPRDWPPAMRFVGPLTESPPFEHEPPHFVPSRKQVLVSLGTHLWWAKEKARKLIREVAEALPDWTFHFTDGMHAADGSEFSVEGNFHRYRYLPYDQYVDQYDAVIHHGGTGVMYACLQHAKPSLVWPQDYDQFDHAARLLRMKLGRRLRPTKHEIVEDLQQMVEDANMHDRLCAFRRVLQRYQPGDFVLDLLSKLES